MPIISSVALGRLWTPVSEAGSRDGFAVEDSDWFWLLVAPTSKRLDELGDAGCLVLLGEPGMGKTTTLRAESDRLAVAPPDGHAVLRMDLASVSSDLGLDDVIAHPTVARWRVGTGVLHLFLDSFDESLGRYRTLTARLLDRLDELPLDRLRLRVACRSGDLPGHFVEELNARWPTSVGTRGPDVRVLLLEPLSRSAVSVWAREKGVDPEAFLREVERRDGRSFAARPITLGPLLDQFRRGRLPSSEVDLFRASCLSLCSELNPAREHEPELTAEQRLALAERVAILTTLAGKDRVWLGDPAATPEDAVPLGDLVGGQEEAAGHPAADRASLRETLGCAPFAVQDHHLVRWSQQVHREFLAANFLARRLPDPRRGLQFFEQAGRPGSTARRIAPQLAEPAAWLAAMDDGAARWIADRDPAALLRARHAIPEPVRADLVAWWLAEEGAGRDVGANAWPERIRAEIHHPGLRDQVRLTLGEQGSGAGARALGCDLAGAARLQSLADQLADLALDVREAPEVRWRAVRALGEAGTEPANSRLLPLLGDAAGAGIAAHHLRGYAMSVLWPAHLATGDALEILARCKAGPGDEYASSFERVFLREATGVQVKEALAWVVGRAGKHDGAVESLVGGILAAAARRLSADGISAALARAMIARVRPRAYVLSPGIAEDVRVALGEQTVADRLGLADDLAADVGSDLDTYAIDEWIVAMNRPCDDVRDRAAAASGTALSLWNSVLRSCPETGVDPARDVSMLSAVEHVEHLAELPEGLPADAAPAADPSGVGSASGTRGVAEARVAAIEDASALPRQVRCRRGGICVGR